MSFVEHEIRYVSRGSEPVTDETANIDESVERTFGHGAFESVDGVQRRDQPIAPEMIFREHRVHRGRREAARRAPDVPPQAVLHR